MTVDLSGGLSADRDGVLLEPPADSSVGENHAFWIFDDAGLYALLCAHVQAPGAPPASDPADARAAELRGSGWENRRLAYAFTLPDGRVITDWQVEGGSTADTVRVGQTSFRRDTPFERWTAALDGTPQVVTASDMMSRPVDADTDRVEFTLNATLEMTRPPWVQGSLAPDSPGKTEALTFIGGDRYEQLYRTSVTGQVGGASFEFAGSGLRTHRVGARSVIAMLGHSWCTAVFPSGRAFAYMAYPRPDWSVSYLEGFVDDTQRRTPVTAAEFPWLTSLDYSGEKFALSLTTSRGVEHIEGETLCHSTTLGRGAPADHAAWTIAHGMARFRWDGEETTGLIERSAPGDRLHR